MHQSAGRCCDYDVGVLGEQRSASGGSKPTAETQFLFLGGLGILLLDLF